MIDTFYVTDLTGQKIENPTRQDKIRKSLLAVMEGTVAGTTPSKTAA